MKNPYCANLVTTNKEAANIAASLMDPDDGSTTFGLIKLKKVGESVVSAWAANTPLSPTGKALFDEFATNGPWPMLESIGITDVPALKEVLFFEYGQKDLFEERLPNFIQELGYERVFENNPSI